LGGELLLDVKLLSEVLAEVAEKVMDFRISKEELFDLIESFKDE